MRRAGRVNILAIVAAVCAIAILGLFFMGRESLNSVGARFMTALAKHDVKTLSAMTFLDGSTPEEVEKQWDFAVNTAGKHYLFVWNITGATQATDTQGTVRMQVVRNAQSPSAFEEKFELPLVKVDGQWKVDVRNISRELFPALPR